MNKLNLLFAFCIALFNLAQAQTTPNAFNYSAVARNVAGQPIASATIGIQISILKTSTTGTVQYSENHFVSTDTFGFFNLTIGEGTIQSGSISTITWGTDIYYIKVGMDVTGGTNFLTMGTTQLMSVPYALHSKTADSIVGVNSKIELDPVFNASVAKNITAKDTIKWNSYSNPTNEFQTLSISNDTIYLSNGGFVKLPNVSGGKTYIELFGDVTDAQADSITKADLGPNTQYIYITNTTKLTTIDLSALKALMELKVTGNEVLASMKTASLTKCTQRIEITDNPLLANIETNKLSYLGSIQITNNSKLSALNFPVLKITANNITINQNGISSISFPVLTTLNKDLEIGNNASLTTASFPELKNFKGVFSIYENSLLSTLSAQSVTTASFINIRKNGLTNLSLPGLTTLSGDVQIVDNASLSTLSANSLSTSKSIYIQNNGLTNVNFSALTTINGAMFIEGNASLSSLIANSLASVGTGNNYSFYIKNNGLTSLNFPALTTLSGNLIIEGNTSLSSFTANSLNTVGAAYINGINNVSINIKNNGLTSLNLTALTTLSGSLNIENNTLLTSLSVNSLSSVGYGGNGNVSISIIKNGFTSLNFPALATLSGGLSIYENNSLNTLSSNSLTSARSIIIVNNGLTSISFPSLTSISEGLNIQQNAALTTLTVSSLNYVGLAYGGSIIVRDNNGLTTLNFPALKTLDAELTITNNTSLKTLNISALNKIPSFNSFQNNLSNIIWANQINSWNGIRLYENNLPSSEINELLSLIVSAGQSSHTGLGTGDINLQDQKPVAPPTGQGINNKSTIQGWGFIVYTD